MEMCHRGTEAQRKERREIENGNKLKRRK